MNIHDDAVRRGVDGFRDVEDDRIAARFRKAMKYRVSIRAPAIAERPKIPHR